MPAVNVGSLAVGVFGHLRADESIYARDDDCYSVFHGLSDVMGLLASARADAPVTGLWGMNDAGGPWLGPDPHGRRAEFQVAPEHGDRPLPIAPFTWAALVSIERFGPLDLHGLEYYLPLGMSGSAADHIQSGKGWFATADPSGQTRLRVTIDSGDSDAASEQADEIVAAMARVSPYEEDVDAVLPDDPSPVDFTDPVPWRWWLGDGTAHTMTFSANATEWSPLAAARVVALAAEACRSIGLTESIGVRVVRADPDA